MLVEKEIRKLLADAYHRAALDSEADMRLVTDALETIRIPFMQEHAMNVWNSFTLNGTALDRPFIRSLLLQLRKQYQQALLQNITGEIQKGFEQSAVKGWEQFISLYTDALIYWNGEIFGPLCEYPFSFSSEKQLSVQQLKKLNRLVFESRWLDAESLYEWLMAQPGVNEAQRAAIHLVLGEIELFHQLRPDLALGHFQEAEKVLGKTSRVLRTYAEYYQKTGDVSQCREMINLAIANDDNDLENFLLMGDTYRDEGKLEIAEQWYRDAINVNFLKADPYVKVMSIYGDPAKYKEKGGEMGALLTTIESLEPETAYTNVVYNAYRDAGSLYSSNDMREEAQDCYRRAIELHTEWVTAYIDLGYALGIGKKYAESEKCFQTALEKDSSCYDALNGMAWLAEQSNDLGQAIEYNKQCLTVRPAAAAIINNNIGVLTGNMGDYAGSKNYYQLAIQSNPRVALYYTNLAYASEKLNDIDTAIKAYEQAITMEPFNAVYHNKLGNLYYSKGDFEHAKACYEHAAEQNGNVAVYYENLGLANFNLGRWSESAAAYEKAVALAPAWSAYNYIGINYYRLGENEKSVANYLRAIELEHSTSILYDNLGLAYDQLGKKEEAEKAFLNALKLEPENYTFLNRLGVFYSFNGDFEKALGYFTKAIQYGKGEAVLYANAALAYEKLHRWSETEDAYLKAIKAEPENDGYLNQLGVFLFNCGRYSDSINYYKRAIEISESSAVYWQNLGLSYSSLHDWPNAIVAYEKSASLAPTKDSFNLLGIAYYNSGEQDKAIDFYLKAIALSPQEAVLYNNLGLSYQSQNKFAEAEQAYQNSIRLDPQNYTYHNLLGVLYYNHGKHSEAIASYKMAIQYGKGEQVLFDNLALACMAAGRYSEARDVFKNEIKKAEKKDGVYNLIGLMHFNEQQLPDAIANYQKAIAINKDEPVYYTNLALAYRDSGKLAEAESAMKQAVQLNPNEENKQHLDQISDLISHESR